MPVKLRSGDLDSASARLKLPPRKSLYRLPVSRGVGLGYRRTADSFGSWSVIVTDGTGKENISKFADADDREPADGRAIMSFDQAMTEARKIARADESDLAAEERGLKSLDAALDDYRDDLNARQADGYNANRARFHLPPVLRAKDVNAIHADELKKWRNSLLKKGLAPSSINRTRNALRAALELAAPHRSHVWKQGLETLPNATRARKLILPDSTIAALVRATYGRDEKLGLLCDVLATTGCRPVQAARLRIEDLLLSDAKKPRLLMNKSAKGGGRNRAEKKLQRYSVPITSALALKLKAAVKGRADDEPLLLKSDGQQWSEANPNGDYRDDWAEIVKALGLGETITAYCFRHSSIARLLLRGLPTKLVADLHDTSEQMVRQHYGKYIVEHSDDIARRTLIDLDAPVADNVVKLAS